MGLLFGDNCSHGMTNKLSQLLYLGFTTGQVDVPLLSLSKLFRDYRHHTKPLGDGWLVF